MMFQREGTQVYKTDVCAIPCTPDILSEHDKGKKTRELELDYICYFS